MRKHQASQNFRARDNFSYVGVLKAHEYIALNGRQVKIILHFLNICRI